MSRITDVKDLVVGQVYKLSGAIFDPVTLEDNDNLFSYAGADVEDSELLVFTGETTAVGQYIMSKRISDKGDASLALVETVK